MLVSSRNDPAMTPRADLAVLFEHPEWQKPLFQTLERRGVRYVPVDLKKAAFSDADAPLAPLYFNQASPSFNDLDALRARAPELGFPVLLKPEQGGSGARIVLVESFAHLEAL